MKCRHLVFTIGLALLAVSLTIPPASAEGPLALGSKPPMADVKMKNVDGREVSIKDVMGRKGTLVIFTCNACPWAKKWESKHVSAPRYCTLDAHHIKSRAETHVKTRVSTWQSRSR